LELIFGLSVLAKVTGKTKLVFEKAGYSTGVKNAVRLIKDGQKIEVNGAPKILAN
jgi:hypothetical protein